MSGSMRTVIVEDDLLITEYLRDLCGEFGAEVVGTASRANEAIDVICQTRPTFILMDVHLRGSRDGVEVAKEIYNILEGPRVIFITGSNEPPAIDRIKSDHPYKILIKPINPEELRAALM